MRCLSLIHIWLYIVAKIMNKYLHMELGKAMSLSGMCVSLSAAPGDAIFLKERRRVPKPYASLTGGWMALFAAKDRNAVYHRRAAQAGRGGLLQMCIRDRACLISFKPQIARTLKAQLSGVAFCQLAVFRAAQPQLHAVAAFHLKGHIIGGSARAGVAVDVYKRQGEGHKSRAGAFPQRKTVVK